MRRLPQQPPNPFVRREKDPRALRRQMVLLAGCLLLAAGFIVAVRQQILAVDYGYKSEALRHERERLLAEQRRLMLELEERSAPARLGQAAEALGMQPTRAAQIETEASAEQQEAPAANAQQQAPGAFVGAATAGGVLRR
jgi:cell division protein FtsL